MGDLAARVREAVVDGGFCYAYHSELDLLGHLYGPGSPAWRMQLRQIDRLVESVVEGLPPGGLLAVVADHGMISVDTADVVDIDGDPALTDGVTDVGGEPRARHIYVAEGAADDVLATWRETLADRAWVVSRDEAIAAGWFGERVSDTVRRRIGDVVAAARGSAALLRRTVEPLESSSDRPPRVADIRGTERPPPARPRLSSDSNSNLDVVSHCATKYFGHISCLTSGLHFEYLDLPKEIVVDASLIGKRMREYPVFCKGIQ